MLNDIIHVKHYFFTKMFVICSFHHAAQLCATHYRTPGLVTKCIIYRLLCLMIRVGGNVANKHLRSYHDGVYLFKWYFDQ